MLRVIFIGWLIAITILILAGCDSNSYEEKGTMPSEPTVSSDDGTKQSENEDAEGKLDSPDSENITSNITEGSMIYGNYTLLKTLDMYGVEKTPKDLILSVALKSKNTYELVFADSNRSLGSIEAGIFMTEGLEKRTWQFRLRDDRNDNEPSYNFALSIENSDTICVLWIPQGVGDNSWLEFADFWILEKSD